jgi:hypothetical protein
MEHELNGAPPFQNFKTVFFKFLKVMKRILDVCKISTKKPYINLNLYKNKKSYIISNLSNVSDFVIFVF